MAARTGDGRLGAAGFQAYVLLRIGFAMAPILFGVDKYFNWMVDWTEYLAPWANDFFPGTAQEFMYFVGALEIAAGLTVAVAPWIGGFVVAAWLGGIIINLLTYDPPLYYDIALRDFGLMLGALVLGRLALAAHRRGRGVEDVDEIAPARAPAETEAEVTRRRRERARRA